MRVNRHIRSAVATLAGSLSLSAPALAADRLFAPDERLVDPIELSQQQRQRAERPKRPRLVYPIKSGRRPDYGSAAAGFGTARGRMHHGQDVFAAAGTALVAIRDGVVIEAGTDGGAGNHIAIYSRKRDRTYAYFHMLAPAKLKPGEKVRAGRRLGAVGCTGSCWGDHLHFEVRKGRGLWTNESIDPRPLLEKAERA